MVRRSAYAQGCLTSLRRLLEGLAAVGAEKDCQGNYLLHGELPPQLFMGIADPDNDVLVTDTMFCIVNGEPKSLLKVAARYGQGFPVVVVG